MRQKLLAAFRQYLAATPDSFLIIEDSERRFVQFSRHGLDVVLDLPSHALSPAQLRRAADILGDKIGARKLDLAGGNFAWQLVAPPNPDQLADLALTVFEKVYGEPVREPITYTIDR